jgi:ABC-type enterochelin transport system substrate-binding protein
VVRVIVRRPALQNEFADAMLEMGRGRRTANSLVQRATGQVAANRSEGTASTAGARGVTVDTPAGKVDVTPNPAAVAAMDRRPVDAVAVDAFVREGRLEPPVPVKEETTQ